MKRKIVKDISSTTISTFVFSFVQFIVQVYVIRLLTKEDYGVYAFTFSLYSIIELLIMGYSVDLAFQQLGGSIVKKDHGAISNTFSRLVKRDLKIYSILFLVASLVLLVPFSYSNFHKLYFFVFLFSLLFQIGYSAIKSTLISYNYIQLQVKHELISSGLMLIVTMVFVYFGGIWGFILSYPTYNLLKNLLGFYILNKFTDVNFTLGQSLQTSAIDGKEQGNLLVTSVLRNGLINLNSQLDLILVGVFFLNPAVVATYKVSKSLNSLAAKVVYPVWASLRGRMMQAYHNADYNRLRQLVMKPMVSIIILFGVLFIPAYWLTAPVIELLYGTGYIDAVIPFLILLVGNVFLQSTNLWFNFWIVISQKAKLGIAVLTIQTLVLLVGALIWGKSSLMSLSIVVSGSIILMSFLQIYYFMKYTPKMKSV